MILSAVNYGYKSMGGDKDFRLPSRRSFVDNVIEGDDGLLLECIEAAVTRLEASAKSCGAVLLFDGAKDACGRSLEVFMIQAGAHQALLWNGLPHDERKTAQWMKQTIICLIEKNMDFEKMVPKSDAVQLADDDSAFVLDVPADDNAGSSSKPESRAKKQKVISSSKLERLFDLTPYIFAAGGDNAGVPVKAVLIWKRKLALYRSVVPDTRYLEAFNTYARFLSWLPMLSTK